MNHALTAKNEQKGSPKSEKGTQDMAPSKANGRRRTRIRSGVRPTLEKTRQAIVYGR
jgi:hypothetical protein